MSATHITMAKLGLLKVQYAITTAIRQPNIMQSFKLCGIYPLDINTILNECTTSFDDKECLDIISKLPKLTPIMGSKGVFICNVNVTFYMTIQGVDSVTDFVEEKEAKDAGKAQAAVGTSKIYWVS